MHDVTAVDEKTTNYSTTVWLALLVCVFASLMLFMVFSLGKSIDDNSIERDILHFQDESSSYTINDIKALPSTSWTINEHQNFGLTKKPQWLRIEFDGEDFDRLVEIDYAMLDKVDIWLFDTSLNPLQYYATGDKLPFKQRPILHDKFLFTLPKRENATVLFLRVQSNGPVKAPLKIWSKPDFISYISTHRLFMGLFFGYMIAMGLINLFIFVTTRTLIYATYAGYVFAFALLIASLHGIGFRFIWPKNIWMQEHSVVIFAFMMMSFVLLFSSKILELKKYHQRFYVAFKVLIVVYVGCTIASFILPYAMMVKLLLILFLFSIPVVLIVTISLASSGSSIAKYFSVAWGILLFSGLAASADNFHWVELPLDSSYLLMIGATTETLLLALAMATNFNDRRQLAKHAHAEAQENEQKAILMQDELIQLQEQAQINLEQEVQARTVEFEEALAKLSSINTDLQNMNELDALTGVMNRQYFDKVYAQECARSRRHRQPLAVAMLDIDHFKKVNDSYGHQCGDDCLVAFCTALSELIKRPGDTLARLGGEEFVILLPNTSIDGASGLLEACRVAIEKLRVSSGEYNISFTVSIGLSSKVIGCDGDRDELLSNADKLLYAAKNAGRNCIKSGSF
ncbi:GGDEF domain-containing protein [Glaciecola sp. MH2013]|uniref:sensor domain-containing diguanylate cyclase n=1 Tax=Glaciecola sp. MH2013 TaxID=2785524 RepID=UPI00189CF80B|nr:diguanylate cyclase [Glaciecola sp. MH2013]MBF7073821.1 GGDEF domain-containing protein [Glaciecola sp. MH2013]